MSYDVVSLFTKTPIKETCEVIRERTNLKVDNITELLKFVLATTYFRFGGDISQQKFGVAMDSQVSPIGVKLYMENLEQTSWPWPQMIASQGTGSRMWMV